MEEKLEKIIRKNYYFNASHYIKRGGQLFGKNAGKSVVATLIYLALYGASASIPFASLLIAWPLSAGFYVFARTLASNQEPEYNQFFEGFNNFGNLFVAYLLSSIFIFLGFIVFVIPGIYLLVAYTLVQPIIVFSDMKPLAVLEYSRKIVSKHWFDFFVLGLFILLINLIGILFIGLGLLITIPITYYISYAIYEDIIDDSKPKLEEDDEIPSAKDLGLDLDDYFHNLEKD